MTAILHDTLTPALPPAPPCPEWCVAHDVTPEPDGSVLHVHEATVIADAAGYRVRVRQGVYVETGGRIDDSPPPTVVLDHEEMAPGDVRRLIAALARAAEIAGGAR